MVSRGTSVFLEGDIWTRERDTADAQTKSKQKPRNGQEKHPSQDQKGIDGKLMELEDTTIKTTPKENRGVYKAVE